MSGGGARVSIPHSVRKTIQNIKEIAGNHGDEEIYAMLRECSMDPNETAQKLLLQDTFHEVKRKRDKKKESNREPADTRWRPGSQGRGTKGGRGNYSPRYISHDAGGGKNLVKENGSYQVAEKSTISVSSPPTQDTEYKPTSSMSSSVAGLPNGPIKVENAISVKGSASEESGVSGTASVEESSVPIVNNTGAPPLGDAKCSASRQHESSSAQSLPSKTRAPDSGLYASDSDPVLVTSVDAHILGSVGTIKCQGESQKVVAEIYNNRVDICDVSSSELSSLTRKGSSETNNSYIHAKMQGQSQGFEGNQLLDTSQVVSSSSHTSSAGSRPSSNYSSRSQQLNGPQKVGPAKEWKPKSGNIIPSQAPVTLDSSNSEAVIGDVTAASLPASSSIDSEDPTSKLQKRLEELQFSETRHVIIPNHLQVPESERIGLSFGSFDSNFGLTARFVNELESDKSSTHLSESSQDIEENVEEPISGIEKASLTSQEAVYPAPSQSSEETPDNFSSKEPDISSGNSTAKECDQLKPEAAAASEGAQFSVVHTTPSYSNFGVVPQVLGSQFATFDSAEPQARDASRLPGFVVQQPFDPSTSYYTSMYRPAADSDGRFTPVLTLGAAPKYNGNIAVLPSQAGQSPQENGNSLVLSPTGQTPLVTQATGMQSSVPVSQQSVPVFRQPASVQIPHFPPNYMPYSQYFSPYYIPHPFLSNAAFPQQPPTGGIYPPPVAAAGATPIKYSVSQYKSATNTGSPALGTLTGYGAYGPAVTGANSTDSEDLNSAQYKENNVFIAGQQSEAPAVWIPTPGRDISVLQATSFYNLPPQGHQHVTFAPTQVSHGAFPGIYQHPAQTVAAGVVHPMLQQSQAMAGPIEMVGPPGVYQQPQRAQVNWVNNYNNY